MKFKAFDLDIITDGQTVRVSIFHHDSGDYWTKEFPVSVDEHPAFNEEIGNQLYAWISMMVNEICEEGDSREEH